MSPNQEVVASQYQNSVATNQEKAPETSSALKNTFMASVRRVVARIGLASSMAVASSLIAAPAGEGLFETPIASAATGGYPDVDARDCSATNGPYAWCKNGSDISPRGFGYRNCTDWAAFRVQQITGVKVPYGTNMGDATLWDNNAPRHGFSVDTTPEVGDIAVWDFTTANKWGHVAIVETVNPNGTVNISEYNHFGNGTFGTRSGIRADKYIDVNGVNHVQPSPAPNVDLPTFVPDIVQRPDGETNVAAVGPGNSLDFYYNQAGSTHWGKLAVAVGGYAFSSPDMVQRPSGETNIAIVGPNNSLDFYINTKGSPAWGKLTVAGPGSAYSKPAIIQRPSGETDIAVRGPNNTLDYYYNFQGSPAWHKLPVATPNQAFSAPAITQRPSGETNIAVLGPENSLDFYYNTQGSPYWGISRVAIRGWAFSAPAMVQRPSGETDIAVQGPNNTLDFYINQQGSPAWGRIQAAGSGSTHVAPNAPSVLQRPNGETNIAVKGPGSTADFYFNSQGSPAWGKVPVAITGYSQRTPAMIQRPTTGETDLVIVGPSNRLDFYINRLGSPAWGNLPIAPNHSAS